MKKTLAAILIGTVGIIAISFPSNSPKREYQMPTTEAYYMSLRENNVNAVTGLPESFYKKMAEEISRRESL